MIMSTPLYEEHIILAVPKTFQVNEKLNKYKIGYDNIKLGLYLNDEFPVVDMSLLKDTKFIMLKKREMIYMIGP